jgi:hypothetical protein
MTGLAMTIRDIVSSPSRPPLVLGDDADARALDALSEGIDRERAMSPLYRRYFQCEHLRQIDLDRLLVAGVPQRALSHPDSIVRAWVKFGVPWRRFEFASDADEEQTIREAFIFVAYDLAGMACDLVAWTPTTGDLASWLGCASVLGAENLFGPRLSENGALLVHRTPLNFLRAGRSGIVIVDESDAADLLRAASPLEVGQADYALAAHLRKRLARPTPRVFIASPTFERAE